MTQNERSQADPPAVSEMLKFFGWKWAGFWVWLDAIGRNAQPLPTPRASDKTARQSDPKS
jgi:hypothetical protein